LNRSKYITQSEKLHLISFVRLLLTSYRVHGQ